MFSAYSPYSAAGEQSLAKNNGAADKAFYLAKIKDSEKRFKGPVIPTAISKKAWGEVTTILTRQLYSLRKSMNFVATTQESKDLAKAFYQSIEALNLACLRKNQAVAQAAYETSLKAFDAYLASI